MAEGTLVTEGLAARAVTFVENHDIVRDDPVVNDKMLAYAYILTHEGYPCVFWQEYHNWQLAREDEPTGIAALLSVHEQYAGGGTTILYCDDDLYVMQRQGTDSQSGLIFVLNNSGVWNGTSVITRWANRSFKPIAWCGDNNTDTPEQKYTDQHGATDFWAPPGGYVVFIPT